MHRFSPKNAWQTCLPKRSWGKSDIGRMPGFLFSPSENKKIAWRLCHLSHKTRIAWQHLLPKCFWGKAIQGACPNTQPSPLLKRIHRIRIIFIICIQIQSPGKPGKLRHNSGKFLHLSIQVFVISKLNDDIINIELSLPEAVKMDLVCLSQMLGA